MTMLAVALPWTTALSINLRCATLLLPIAIDRPSPPLHRPLPNQAVNAPQQQTASAEIPIASDAPLRHISRGFLPWRFADAGPAARGTVIMGRHPKTFTNSEELSTSICFPLCPQTRTLLDTFGRASKFESKKNPSRRYRVFFEVRADLAWIARSISGGGCCSPAIAHQTLT